jgi:hypothetical protein
MAGAVAETKFTKIQDGEWAQAGTSSLYCQAWRDNNHGNTPAFDCGFWDGNVHLPGSYSVSIGEWGVDVYEWDATGRKYQKVGTWTNP